MSSSCSTGFPRVHGDVPRSRSQEFSEAGTAVRIVRERVLESRLARSGGVRHRSEGAGLHDRPHGQAQAPSEGAPGLVDPDAYVQLENMQLE